MSEWAVVPLGDVLNRVRRKVNVRNGASYPAVSVTMYGRGLGEKEPFVGGVTGYETLFEVRTGDVVLRTITAFESPVGVALQRHDGTHVSQVFLTYEVLPSAVPAYLSLTFQSPQFWDAMQNRATGTVLRRKTISHAAFCGIPITLPSLAEQRRVVAVIAAVDAQIEAMEAEIPTAWTGVEAVADSLWADHQDADANHRLADVFALVDCEHKTAPAVSQRESVAGYSIGTSDVRKGAISVVGAKAVTESTLQEWTARTRPERGDLILTREAPVGEIGRLSEVAEKVCLGQRTVLLRPIANLDGDAVWALILSPSGQRWFREHSMGLTVQRVNIKTIRDFPIPAKLDRGTVRAVDAAWRLHRHLTTELATLRTVRADLLSAVLAQEVSVDEAVDRYIDAGTEEVA